MPWDLTDDEAQKFNALSSGQHVDLTPEEATKFQPIFAERAQQKKPEPGLTDLALNAAKELVTPSRQEVSTPGNPVVGMRQNALTQAGAVASAFDIGAHRLPFVPEALSKGAEQWMQEGRQTYPKTALAAGLLAPFPSKTKEQMLVAGGLGALHGAEHAKPGEMVRDAVTGGLVNAGIAGVTGKVIEGGGKLLGPAARKLMEKLGVNAEALGAEPRTVPESPMDLQAKQNAQSAALAGEQPLVPENLKTPWFGAEQDPALTAGSTHTPTKASFRPEPRTVTEPPTVTSALVGRRSPADLESPTVTDNLSERARKMMGSGPLPGEPNTAAKLEAVGSLTAERPTFVDDPRAAAFDRESGYWEAFNEDARGNPEPLKKWFAENPQIEKGLKQAMLPTAEEYRLRVGPGAKTGALPTANLRDEMGTASLRAAKPAEPVDAALQWLSGEGESAPFEKTLTRYVPRDINAPSHVPRDPEATFVRNAEAPSRDAFIMGGAGTPPRPAGAPVGGPPVSAPLDPTDMNDDFLAQVKASQKLLSAQLSTREKIARQLSLPENRADDVDKLLGMTIRSFKASKTTQDIQMQSLYPRLKAAVEKLPFAQRGEVQRIITRLRDRSATLDEVAKLPEEFRNLFQVAQAESQAQLVQLAKAGYFSPGEISSISKNLQRGLLHLHRTYAAFAVGQKWRAPDEAVQKAAEWIAKEGGLSTGDALARVRAILKTAAEGEGFRSVNDLATALRNNGLVKRRVLPPQLHALLGVVNDPAFITAETASQMTGLHQLYLRTRAFADPQFKGRVWSDVPAPGFDERKLWIDSLSPADNKRAFGELAGKYVPPTLREAMTDTPPKAIENVFLSLAKKATNWFSFSKVLTSPMAAVRDVISSGLYMSASGVPQHWQASKFVPSMKALLALHGNFSSLDEGKGLARMALEDGAIQLGKGSDFGGSEARRIVEDALKGAGEGLPGIWDKVTRGYTNVRAKLGLIRELLDNAGRLTAYSYHLKTGRETLGLSPMEARAHASHLVNRYFATGAGVPPVVRGLQRSQAGLAPFIGWNVDNMRVTKNILEDVTKGNFGPLARASAWMGGPFIASAVLNKALGVTDADRAAGEHALKGSWKATHPLRVWLPFRGPDGKLVYVVSLDGINPMGKFFAGSDAMSPAQKVGASLINGLTDGGAFEGWADRLMARAGIQPQPYEPELLPGQEGYAIAGDVAKYMEPALMGQYRTVARRAQLAGAEPLGASEEPMSLGVSAARMVSPLSYEKVGPRSQRGAMKQLRGERGDLLDAQKQVRKLQAPDERSRVLEAIHERVKGLRERMAK